jgi:ATP-dependent Clp protease adaptor protein ClpS
MPHLSVIGLPGAPIMRGSTLIPRARSRFVRLASVVTRPRPEAKVRTERPKAYKVILLNDDFTPREFVISVLCAIFRMTSDQARGVMLTAHMRGCCVVAVYTREIAETKAHQAIDMGQREGYPLMFTTEPEE